MNFYSIGLDVVVLIVVLACAFFYARSGFIAGIISFFGTLLALVGSIFAANWLSPIVFDGLFRTGLEERVAALLNQTGVQTVGDVLEKMFGFLPRAVADFIGTSFGEGIATHSPEAAGLIVEKAVMPLVVPIISVVVFLVFFVVLRILVGLLSRLLTNVNKIPLLGAGNRILGCVAGIFIGALYSFLILCLIWSIDAAYGGGMLAPEYFGASLVYRLTAGFNIFAPGAMFGKQIALL